MMYSAPWGDASQLLSWRYLLPLPGDHSLWSLPSTWMTHFPACSSSQRPWKGSASEAPLGSSPHFLIFSRVFAKLHLCLASASLPFPTPDPYGSNSSCTYGTIKHRNTHVQYRILLKENLVEERLLYSYQHLSLD